MRLMMRSGMWAETRLETLRTLFGAMLLTRLLYPFFNSPLSHLFSDPLRHWENGGRLLHPSIMGSSDPILFQVWIFAVRSVSGDSAPAVSLASGILCAAMPYGWYRALRELESRERALAGALIVALIPESISLYGYFMNETLLLALIGFCFWATLRAYRKRHVAAFALAVFLWFCAVFTRTIVLPMVAGCLAVLWVSQSQKIAKASAGVTLALLFIVPAGLHSRMQLHFFSPLGNAYFNEIYEASGAKEIVANYGPEGTYNFGCPSFYNPTFYPFSQWTTDRTGVASIAVDLTQGRAPWKAELERVARERAAQERVFPAWRQRMEAIVYTLFGQTWPNSDPDTWMGWLTLWSRWLWAPLILVVAAALVARRFTGAAYLLPVCGLGTVLLLVLQSESPMEARYREPVDAILVCSALLIEGRRRADGIRIPEMRVAA
jgi:hypothetical protein